MRVTHSLRIAMVDRNEELTDVRPRKKRRRLSIGPRRLLNNARWGKDGKWAKMADTLESVPVLGETALAPMTGFLRGAVDLYTTFRPDA